MQAVLVLFNEEIHDQFVGLQVDKLRADANLRAGHDVVWGELLDQLLGIGEKISEDVFLWFVKGD